MALTVLKVQRMNLAFREGGLIIEAEYHACVEKGGMLRSFAAGAAYVEVDERLAALAKELFDATESTLNRSWDLSPSEEVEDPERPFSAPEDEEPL